MHSFPFSYFRLLGASLLIAGGCAGSVQAVTMEYVSVGQPGNAAEPNNIYNLPNLGSVLYAFRMGKYEVTNAQYVEFLNAKAATDPYSLYSGAMGSDAVHGGIVRSGADGSYTYAAKPGFDNKPVVYVNFFDAVRFANWLHNGQGTGDTEDGAYFLSPNPSSPPFPANAAGLTRKPGATVFIPDENEWYKAAFFQSGSTYWSFPTRSNTAPTAEPPAGGSNSANFASAAGSPTNVGAYHQAPSPSGTFDQGGNVQEWMEIETSGYRFLRGGHFANSQNSLSVLGRGYAFSHDAYEHTGFRVASAVPPPEIPAPPRGLGRIMPLGDSLTQSQNNLFGYRYHLWVKLLDQGVDFDFVGTLLDNGIGGYPAWPNHQGKPFDQNHEGHSGLSTDQIRDNVLTWTAGYVPDVVLLIAGTNDALQGRAPSLSVADLKETIVRLRTRNPIVSVFLAKIPPVAATTYLPGGGGVPVNTGINALNALIPSVAADLNTPGSRVIIVDLNTGFDFATEGLPDGYHPNEIGEQKIASRFFEALQVLTLTSTPGFDNDGHLTMSFLRVKSPFQLAYHVEISSDLTQWFSGATETELAGLSVDYLNGTEGVVIRDKKSSATEGRRFIRLRLSYSLPADAGLTKGIRAQLPPRSSAPLP